MDSHQNNGNGHNGNGHKKRGPQTPEGRAKALANLTHIKPGQRLNPAGRPSAGASVKDWWNIMQGWSRKKLEAVIADNASPVNKVAAAQAWLNACKAGNDLDRILEHTAGRAAQSLDLTSGGESILLPLKLDGDREL